MVNPPQMASATPAQQTTCSNSSPDKNRSTARATAQIATDQDADTHLAVYQTSACDSLHRPGGTHREHTAQVADCPGLARTLGRAWKAC